MDIVVTDSRILVKGSLGSYNLALILEIRKMKAKVFIIHSSQAWRAEGKETPDIVCWPNAWQRVTNYKSL